MASQRRIFVCCPGRICVWQWGEKTESEENYGIEGTSSQDGNRMERIQMWSPPFLALQKDRFFFLPIRVLIPLIGWEADDLGWPSRWAGPHPVDIYKPV